MKALLALRPFRQVHCFRKAWHNLATILQRQRGGSDLNLVHNRKQDVSNSVCIEIYDDTISMTCEDEYDGFCDRDVDNTSCKNEFSSLSDEVDESLDNRSQRHCQVSLVDASDKWEVMGDRSHGYSLSRLDHSVIEEDDSIDGYPY
jgi:hypothetical protein